MAGPFDAPMNDSQHGFNPFSHGHHRGEDTSIPNADNKTDGNGNPDTGGTESAPVPSFVRRAKNKAAPTSNGDTDGSNTSSHEGSSGSHSMRTSDPVHGHDDSSGNVPAFVRRALRKNEGSIRRGPHDGGNHGTETVPSEERRDATPSHDAVPSHDTASSHASLPPFMRHPRNDANGNANTGESGHAPHVKSSEPDRHPQSVPPFMRHGRRPTGNGPVGPTGASRASNAGANDSAPVPAEPHRESGGTGTNPMVPDDPSTNAQPPQSTTPLDIPVVPVEPEMVPAHNHSDSLSPRDAVRAERPPIGSTEPVTGAGRKGVNRYHGAADASMPTGNGNGDSGMVLDIGQAHGSTSGIDDHDNAGEPSPSAHDNAGEPSGGDIGIGHDDHDDVIRGVIGKKGNGSSIGTSGARFRYADFIDIDGDDDNGDDGNVGDDAPAFSPDWIEYDDDNPLPPSSGGSLDTIDLSGFATGDSGDAGTHDVVDKAVDLSKHDESPSRPRSRVDARHYQEVMGNTGVVDDDYDSGYRVDSQSIAENVASAQIHDELNSVLRKPKDIDKALARRIVLLEWQKKKHIPFNANTVKIFDYLTRWSYATTAQVARAVGWTDRRIDRIDKKLSVYADLGWLHDHVVFAGPKLWYPASEAAKLSVHPWLGGVNPNRINPMSQSHSLGLSSIASWLLCPWDNAPNILGLDDWGSIRKEIQDGSAMVLGEREYRSAWASLRISHKGLIPAEYRHAFIGSDFMDIDGLWQQWAMKYKQGVETLQDSPEYAACDPLNEGSQQWLWTVWGNYIWNPERIINRIVMEEGIDPKNLSNDERFRLFCEYREDGYIPVEDRLDVDTNRPTLQRLEGDKFALLDHLPDIVIVRERDPRTGLSQNIAVELELSAKSEDDYARTMAGFGTTLGRTLYGEVVWVVRSVFIANMIERGAKSVGLVRGKDYHIVPFITKAQRNSFYSGADIIPARFNEDNTKILPVIGDNEFPLS